MTQWHDTFSTRSSITIFTINLFKKICSYFKSYFILFDKKSFSSYSKQKKDRFKFKRSYSKKKKASKNSTILKFHNITTGNPKS